MIKISQLLFGLATLSLVSFNTIDTPSSKKAKEIIYTADTQQSKLTWNAKKVTGEHSGTAPIRNGSLTLENGKLKAGSFDVDLKALTVTDITDADNNAKLVGHLKSDDFFSVEKHPTASFVLSSATPTGNDTYSLTGKLTIKGISNDIKFPAELKADNGKLTATANITVDRTKYDIKYRSKNFFENIGDKAIYDDFTLAVTLVATPTKTVANR